MERSTGRSQTSARPGLAGEDALQVDREHRRGGHQAAEQHDEQDRGAIRSAPGAGGATTK